MKTASAFGFGALSLNFMNGEAVAESMSSDEVKFVRATKNVDGERKAVYDTMARARWDRIKSAARVRDRLNDRLERRFKSLGVEWRPMDDSPTGFGVRVVYRRMYGTDGELIAEPDASLEEVKKAVPGQASATVGKNGVENQVTGIPVEVRTSTAHLTSSCSGEPGGCADRSSTNYSSPIPGGIPIGISNGAKGSLTTKFTHPDYGDGWVTAGHLAGSNGNSVLYPSPTAGVSLGKTRDQTFNSWAPADDYAFVENTSGYDEGSVTSDGSNGGDYWYDVVGVLSESAIQDDAANDVLYETMGAGTCTIANNVVGTTTNGVKVDNDTESGDSGGLIYQVRNGCAYLAGMPTWGENFNSEGEDDSDECPDDAGGPRAEFLERAMNGAFGTYLSC